VLPKKVSVFIYNKEKMLFGACGADQNIWALRKRSLWDCGSYLLVKLLVWAVEACASKDNQVARTQDRREERLCREDAGIRSSLEVAWSKAREEAVAAGP